MYYNISWLLLFVVLRQTFSNTHNDLKIFLEVKLKVKLCAKIWMCAAPICDENLRMNFSRKRGLIQLHSCLSFTYYSARKEMKQSVTFNYFLFLKSNFFKNICNFLWDILFVFCLKEIYTILQKVNLSVNLFHHSSLSVFCLLHAPIAETV